MKITKTQLKEIIKESILDYFKKKGQPQTPAETPVTEKSWSMQQLEDIRKNIAGKPADTLEYHAVEAAAWATARMNNYHKPFTKKYNGGVTFKNGKFYVNIGGKTVEVPS